MTPLRALPLRLLLERLDEYFARHGSYMLHLRVLVRGRRAYVWQLYNRRRVVAVWRSVADLEPVARAIGALLPGQRIATHSRKRDW